MTRREAIEWLGDEHVKVGEGLSLWGCFASAFYLGNPDGMWTRAVLRVKVIVLGVDGSHVPIFEGTIANLDTTGIVCHLNSSSGGFIEW